MTVHRQEVDFSCLHSGDGQRVKIAVDGVISINQSKCIRIVGQRVVNVTNTRNVERPPSEAS